MMSVTAMLYMVAFLDTKTRLVHMYHDHLRISYIILCGILMYIGYGQPMVGIHTNIGYSMKPLSIINPHENSTKVHLMPGSASSWTSAPGIPICTSVNCVKEIRATTWVSIEKAQVHFKMVQERSFSKTSMSYILCVNCCLGTRVARSTATLASVFQEFTIALPPVPAIDLRDAA